MLRVPRLISQNTKFTSSSSGFLLKLIGNLARRWHIGGVGSGVYFPITLPSSVSHLFNQVIRITVLFSWYNFSEGNGLRYCFIPTIFYGVHQKSIVKNTWFRKLCFTDSISSNCIPKTILNGTGGLSLYRFCLLQICYARSYSKLRFTCYFNIYKKSKMLWSIFKAKNTLVALKFHSWTKPK